MEAYQEQQIYEQKIRNLENDADLSIIEKLKPKFGKDGNRFYFLLGEDLMQGIAGFGETVEEAVRSFVVAYYSEAAELNKGKL